MSTKRSDHITPETLPEARPDGVGRRAVLQTLLGGVGAGVVLPGLAEAQHPVHHHLANGAAVAAAQEQAAAGAAAEFLDAHQMKTLEVLAEAIVPGSTEARVAQFLDLLIAVDGPDDQRKFLSTLGAFDMAAIEKHGKPWVALAPAEQQALLEHASTAASGARPGGDGTSTIRDHFNSLRGWVSGAYYSSEKGMRELGWTGNVFHQSLPGCTHGDGHAG